MDQEPICCKAIIEMLGGPKEHIFTTLKDFVEKKVKDKYQVNSAEFAEPVAQGKLFSTYVELDMEFEKVDDMLAFSHACLPSSIEVYKPDQVTFSLHDVNNLLNDFATRVHETDKNVKVLQSNIALLNKNSISILRNFIRFIIRSGSTSLDDISIKVGISTNELKPFLNRMIEDNQLTRSDDAYAVP